MTFWSILLPFDICYLVYFSSFWYGIRRKIWHPWIQSATNPRVPPVQGDRIGRIFVHWAIIVCFGQFFNRTSSPNFGILFSRYKLHMHRIRQKWVGQHFGRFFTNSSGHTAPVKILSRTKRAFFAQVPMYVHILIYKYNFNVPPPII
jgi:hypothetical protein